jgi:hypothetical protein
VTVDGEESEVKLNDASTRSGLCIRGAGW